MKKKVTLDDYFDEYCSGTEEGFDKIARHILIHSTGHFKPFAYYFLRDETLASEALSKLLEKLYQKTIEQRKAIVHFDTYVHSILYYTCADIWKKKRKRDQQQTNLIEYLKQQYPDDGFESISGYESILQLEVVLTEDATAPTESSDSPTTDSFMLNVFYDVQPRVEKKLKQLPKRHQRFVLLVRQGYSLKDAYQQLKLSIGYETFMRNFRYHIQKLKTNE